MTYDPTKPMARLQRKDPLQGWIDVRTQPIGSDKEYAEAVLYLTHQGAMWQNHYWEYREQSFRVVTT